MSASIPIQPTHPAAAAAQAQQPGAPAAAQSTGGPDFADVLQQAQGLRFSNHAQKRIQSRSIPISDETVARLAGAVDKAEKRGGQSSLVMMDDLAFIVNVRERLVVTALDTTQGGEGVFTQIDSVVIADPVSGKADS